MNAILFVALIVGGTALLSWPLGRYMKWAMDPDVSHGGLAGKFDRLFHLFGGRFTGEAQNWKQYIVSMLVFNVLMFVVSFGIMALQQHLPLNPGRQGRDRPAICIFNTAASFTSNTNLQHYSGESR